MPLINLPGLDLGGFKRLAQLKPCLIDNTTFRLHYQYTFALLCLACVLQTAKQYFGDPIDCIVEGVPAKVFTNFCWIHGTFTLPSQLTGRIGRDHAHPGVGPHSSSPTDPNLVSVTEEGDEIRHAWYQWVFFVLLFQAVLCYFPHFLWKTWEGGKLALLLQGLDEKTLCLNREGTKDKRDIIASYVLRNLRTHNLYVYKFIFCELLNLVNIIGQMFLMDAFFGGQFTTYGWDVVTLSGMDMEDRIDPMAKVFPKMSKCTFHKYGPSGTIINHDGLCILPINIINEKIYVFLWFWFLVLLSWTIVFLLFRTITIFSRYSRYLVFCGRAKSSNRGDIQVIMDKFWFGDWFILMQLCKHMDPMVFHDLVIDLRDRIGPKRSESLEMRNANMYPTLPHTHPMMEKPKVPYLESP